jgi:hypothetical protein
MSGGFTTGEDSMTNWRLGSWHVAVAAISVLTFALVLATRWPATPPTKRSQAPTRGYVLGNGPALEPSLVTPAATQTQTGAGPPIQPPAPVTIDLDRALAVLNDGIGDQGEAVDRTAIESALLADPELRHALAE